MPLGNRDIDYYTIDWCYIVVLDKPVDILDNLLHKVQIKNIVVFCMPVRTQDRLCHLMDWLYIAV